MPVKRPGPGPLMLPAARLVPTGELYLDSTNPRLAGEKVGIDDQEKILRILWEERAVDELVSSIDSNGFWQHESLFATHEYGWHVVVEGNRRLAAVRSHRIIK